MKSRILLIVTSGIVLAAGLFGAMKKKSYTNLTAEDYLSLVQVAELPGKMAVSDCANLEETLPQMPVIIRVEAVKEMEHLFGVSRQKVCVREVYQGDGIVAGDEIYLYSNHWNLALTGDPYTIERGFINIMDIGTQYLAFSTGQTEDLYSDTPSYQLYDDSLIAPLFCYENKENQISETNGMTTYVPYVKVRDNEFFGEDEEAVRAFEQLKEKLLLTYPCGEDEK
ncbi:MAG: hypothetical protein ACI4AD_10650 [Roseburia sp.]